MAFLLILWIIIPTFTLKSVNDEYKLLILFYGIGAYLRKFNNSFLYRYKWLKYLFCFGGLALLIASIFILNLVNKDFGTSISILQLCADNSAIALIFSIGFFLTINSIKIKNRKLNNSICFISASTFGVYLIHDNPFMREWIWKKVFNDSYYLDNYIIILYLIGCSLAVFILCLLIDIIVRNTIEKYAYMHIDKHLITLDTKLHEFIILSK